MTQIPLPAGRICERAKRAPLGHSTTRASRLSWYGKESRLYAYWDACPHYGDTPMAWRSNAYLNAAGDRIVCASHGAEFDIETGRCTLGAALGRSLTPAPIEATPEGAIVLPGIKSVEEELSAQGLRVLIIGGGFSGMSAAIEFRKAGANVEIVEIDPGWRSYGAGITLGGATLRAFERSASSTNS